MFELTQLFWYKPIFMAELLIAEWLFSFRLKRRNRYYLRIVGSLIICFGFAFGFPIVASNVTAYDSLYSIFMFFSMFVLTLLMLKFCYNVSWASVIFCGIAGYTAQHIAYEAYDLIIVSAGLLEEGSALGFYSNNLSDSIFPDPVTELIYFFSYIVIYWLIFIVFANRLQKNKEINIRNIPLFALLALIIIIDIAVSSIITYYSNNSFDKTYIIIQCVSNFVCCWLALFFQFELLQNKELKSELEIVNQLWYKEREQYYISKENIELINLKCHDMKHQISLIGSLSEDTANEVTKVISIYDSVIKTNNEVLDIILTEKSLVCNKNNIRFSCIADGSKLNFITAEDLYSLFGNIIDNAIEAVRQLDIDKRNISLSVKTANSFLSINVFNYYDKDLEFVNGLPLTTKQDKNYHGFGMKSIRMIVDKYGGNLFVSAEKNVFELNILFPFEKADTD